MSLLDAMMVSATAPFISIRSLTDTTHTTHFRPKLLSTPPLCLLGATSPRSPAGQHGRGRNVPHDGQFKVNLPWFNTAEEAPEAAEEFWASPRVDWVRHRWETLDSYSKVQHCCDRSRALSRRGAAGEITGDP